jgi:hypothetical protein
LHFALRLHSFLQLAQRGQARFQLRIHARLLLDLRMRVAPLLLDDFLAARRLFQYQVLLFQLQLLFFQLHAQVVQVAGVGQVQAAALLLQALAPRGQVREDVRGIALVRGRQLDALLDLHDAGARFGGPVLRVAPRRFQVGQALVLRFRRDLRAFHAGRQFFQAELRFFDLLLRLVRLVQPLLALRRERPDLVLQPGARLDDELDLRFQAADLGIGLVQRPLRRVQAVARRVMRLAHALQVQLEVAQFRVLLFQPGLRLFHLLEPAQLLGLRLVATQKPQQFLFFFLVRLQLVEAVGDGRLCLQLFQVGVQFAQDVLDALQVLARVGQAVLRLAAALLVFRDAGRLLEEDAQLFRARFDDARDHALADDGVGARPQARAEEDVLDVAPAHGLAVDVVRGRTIARQGALDGDLGILAPLAGRLAGAVVEHQLDRGAAGRLAQGGAVEDHVLHRLAAQLRRFRFAQHPAYGIDDVRFAASVRADHADQLPRHLEIGGIDERLKSRQFDGG